MVWGATTGLVPVTVYVVPAAGVGAVTTIVPVGVPQEGCIVTLAVGVAGNALTRIVVVIDNPVREHPEGICCKDVIVIVVVPAFDKLAAGILKLPTPPIIATDDVIKPVAILGTDKLYVIV